MISSNLDTAAITHAETAGGGLQDHKTKVGEPDYTGFGVNFAIYLDPVDAETGALRVRAPSPLFPLVALSRRHR